MSLHENPQIEKAIDALLATGKYASADEVMLVALKHLAAENAEYESCLADMQESIADEKAGRMKPATFCSV